jgi:periplasmic protein CpxP/Spy
MVKSKIWITIVVILLIINTVLLAFLWLGKRPRRMAGGSAKDYLIKELSLTEAQIKQYEDLRERHISGIRKVDNDMRDLKDNMFDNLSSTTIDTNKVNGLLQQIGRNESAKDSITFYHFRNLRSILNKGQQEKFDKIIKNALQMMAVPQGPPMRDRRAGNEPPMREPPPGNEPPPEGEFRPRDTPPH